MSPREHLDRYVAAVNAGDVAALRDLMAPEIRVVDHRPLGWEETVGREAVMAVFEGWSTLSPDFQASVQPLAVGSRSSLVRYLFHGVAEHGVEWENEFIIFSIVENGQTTLGELYATDDADAALARFAESDAQTA